MHSADEESVSSVNSALSLPAFPRDFANAFVFKIGQEKDFKSPFTKKWLSHWKKIAEDQKTLQALESFTKKEGDYFIEKLAKHGANPNFMMAMLVKYLWKPGISTREDKDPAIEEWNEYLLAVQTTRRYYQRCYANPILSQFSNLFVELIGGSPNPEVEKFLEDAERKITQWLQNMDFRPASKRTSPNEVVNRTIFAIHQHFIVTTRRPNWELFWNLLVAAGAIKGGGTKSQKDRQILPHIRSFENDHRQEVEQIRILLSAYSCPFSFEPQNPVRLER